MAKNQKINELLRIVAGLQLIARDTCMKTRKRNGLEAEFRRLRFALKIDRGGTFCQSDEEMLDAAKVSLASIESCLEEAATTESEWRKISEALAELKKEIVAD